MPLGSRIRRNVEEYRENRRRESTIRRAAKRQNEVVTLHHQVLNDRPIVIPHDTLLSQYETDAIIREAKLAKRRHELGARNIELPAYRPYGDTDVRSLATSLAFRNYNIRYGVAISEPYRYQRGDYNALTPRELKDEVDKLRREESITEEVRVRLLIAFDVVGSINYRIYTVPDENYCKVFINEVFIIRLFGNHGIYPKTIGKSFLELLNKKLFNCELESIDDET